MNLKLKLALTFLSIFFCSFASAQFTLKFTEQDRLLKQSIEHYEYGHYQKARDLAEQYISKGLLKTARTPQGSQDNLYLATAQFYKYLSNVGLNGNGALADLGLFLAETPYVSLQQYGYFKMAKSLFAQQSFKQAIPFYEKSSINYLSNIEITERNFELAYCYLLNNQLEKVQPLFASIKDVKGEYFSPGNYYHGVLSYYSGNYDEALKSFDAVKNQEQYRDIVPFYIAELNYFKGNKDAALKQALDYTRNTKAPYYYEMSQLAGQVYYEKEDYKNAQKYLSTYTNHTKTARNDDYFRLAYIKYQMGELNDAATLFSKVKNNGTDLYAQSLYYLGLCYLKSGDKQNALTVFNEALKTKKLAKLAEDVSFNSAKLSYDLKGGIEAEAGLNRFVRTYPQSKYYGDAMEMLALLNIKSKNFEKASDALGKLGDLSPIFQAVYQKINYARGIQLLKNKKADLAIPFFTESQKYPVNENLLGLSEFWKAECHYRLGEYSKALSSSYRFIDKPGAGNSTALIRNAFLTNAYIHMHENDKEKLKLAYTNFLDTTAEISAPEALAEMDSLKPNYIPSHVPFVEANPYVFIYQLPGQQVDFVYKPLPLTPMAYDKQGTVFASRENYIKAGYGTLKTSNVEVGYDLSSAVNSDLYLTLEHRASKSNNYLQQASYNQARLLHRTATPNFDITSALTVERNVARPYGSALGGFNFSDIKNRFFDANLLSKWTPRVDHLGSIQYDATIGFGVYNINNEAANWKGSELSFLLDVPFSKQLNKTTTAEVGVEVQVNGLLGSGAAPQGLRTGSSFLVLKPSLSKKVDDLDITVGLFPAVGHDFHVLPNATISKFTALLNAKITVGVESELLANSYKQLSQVNPFINRVSLQQSKRTLYYAQLFGAAFENFNYSIKVGGGRLRNLPLYINDTLFNSFFDVWYEESANIFSLQANVEYQLNFKTNAGFQFRYEPILSSENYDVAYHYIPLQASAFAKYTYRQKLNLRGDLFLRSGTTSSQSFSGEGEVSLNPAFDLNVKANYSLTNKWSAFVELNNLLSNKYQRWYQYPNFGRSVLAGLVYSFNKSVAD